MVIQRLQNLSLFIALILMTIFAFVPFIELSAPVILGETAVGNASDSLLALSPYSISWGMFAINIVICILLLVTILKFKNLKQQKNLSFISLIIIICYLISVSIVSSLIINAHNMEWTIIWTAIIPILAVVLIAVAIKGIKKDIKILSSYDRIR